MESDSNLGPRRKSARDLAKKVIKDTKITQAPVSLQVIIEHLQKEYNLELAKVDFSVGVSGLLIRCTELDKEYFTIGFNQNEPWCRRRFTIAHEIGHLLFGHTCSKNKGIPSDNEKEADEFAGELLIPTMLIKKDFVKISNIPELSKLYRVSEQAMSIKILNSRILK
jgi:hypothetical protein